ncbi:MAG: hypothetical protein O7C75_08560 [Verrucomicrobia bacterium]|nr:hypothetical protein [Verrucomicrobiota bacterium]
MNYVRRSPKAILTFIVVASVCLIGTFATGVYIGKTRSIPFVARDQTWSIGIYSGTSPINFSSHRDIVNPVLTAEDVTDIEAVFVADPFMLNENSTWYMFFEVVNRRSDHGDIGLAISNDGLNWTYQQIVLDEPFHLSYPYVFYWKNEYYLIPESTEANSIRLYKAVDFPIHWELVRTLLVGNYSDPSIFQYAGRWWMFAQTNPYSNDTLRLYSSENLMGPWMEHPESPIVRGNANIARPGGRVLVLDDRIIRYAQDDYPTYGNQVRGFEITKLTTTSYEEREVSGNPILKGTGSSWNGIGMHHIDPHETGQNEWIAVVDGRTNKKWTFGLNVR